MPRTGPARGERSHVRALKHARLGRRYERRSWEPRGRLRHATWRPDGWGARSELASGARGPAQEADRAAEPRLESVEKVLTRRADIAWVV